MASFQKYQPTVVLAIGAHADDIDFGAAGTLAAWAQAGVKVHYLIITDGSKGTADRALSSESLITTRQQEQQAVATVLGVQSVDFLGYEDGMLENSLALRKDIVRVIRRYKPDTVVAMDPTVVYDAELNFINHPDHRAAGQAALDAVFPLARDHLSFPDLLQSEGLEPHKVAHMLLINPTTQNYYVDISQTFTTKVQALEKHASQISDIAALEEMLKQRAAALGRKTGSQYAEGYMRIDPPVS